jgi:hypothetical protein
VYLAPSPYRHAVRQKSCDQIQAKARTLLGTPGIELTVFLKEPHKIPWGDTDTRILDGDDQEHVS